MEQEAVIRKERIRAYRKKVKTGCLTCKRRHVKCDEERPECLRCSLLGILCGGYQHLDNSRVASPTHHTADLDSSTPTSPDRPLQVFQFHSQKERRALEFFYHKAVPQLSGYFHSGFWKHCVFQLSQDEPEIRYALLALSKMYEDDLFGRKTGLRLGHEDQFGVESYNRAIRSLIRQLHNPEKVRVVLTVCLIFVCIACLRREIPEALNHIDGGIKLLSIWKDNHAELSSEFKLVEETIIPMLAWLNMVGTLFGRQSMSVTALSADSSRFTIAKTSFSSLGEAIETLINIIDECFQFIRSVAELKYTMEIPKDAFSKQLRMEALFDGWMASFQRSKFDHFTKAVGNHMAIRLWLRACLSPYETVWDQFRPQYEDIIQRVESIVNDGNRFPDKQSKEFSFELGILPVLQFVTGKCRFPLLRRRALQVILAAPKRECIFDSSYLHALYERVMHLEEASLGLLEGQIPSDHQLPPESARIHHVDMPPLPSRPEGRPVNFLSKPHGIQGSWHVHSEYIKVDNSAVLRWFELKNSNASEFPKVE